MSRWPDSPMLRLEPLAVPGARHDPSSAYSRLFWLPVLGPTALVLMQFMAGSGDVSLPAEVVARSLGTGGHGRQSALVRTLDRLPVYELAVAAGPWHWLVADALPALPAPLHRRLPDHALALVASASEDCVERRAGEVVDCDQCPARGVLRG